jgi:drug/metabolite transporter (DMT)-like permease
VFIPLKIRNFLLLFLLAALWGPSFLFIKVAVEEIPPFTLVLGRVSIGALLLLMVLRWRGGGLPPPGPVWRHLAFLGLMHNALPFVLFSWGEQYVESALASILNGTTPIFTILLAHALVSDDRLTPAKLVGVAIGFGGLLLLIGPALLGGFVASTWGMLALTAAAVCYGVALVYARLHMRGLPPLVAPAGQMLVATLIMLPLALLFERPLTLPPPSLPALGSLLALGIFGTGLAFIVYYRLVETADASYVSLVTYLIPIFGVILGVLVLGEQLSWNAYAGFALVLLGVMVVNDFLRLARKVRPRPSIEHR